MAYETHITRARHWRDAESAPIELAEWQRYLDADPEMEPAEYAIVEMADGTTMRMEGPGIAVWTGYTGTAETDDSDDADGSGIAGHRVWFTWLGSEIVVRNADAEIRRKMHAVAGALGARVQGDDDEFYGPDGRASDAAAPRPAKGERPWWRKMLG